MLALTVTSTMAAVISSLDASSASSRNDGGSSLKLS